MKITYAPHAKERMAERNVTASQVMETFNNWTHMLDANKPTRRTLVDSLTEMVIVVSQDGSIVSAFPWEYDYSYTEAGSKPWHKRKLLMVRERPNR
jgi:hypothetical protein